MAHLGPELVLVGAVNPRAVSTRERQRRVERRAGDRHRVLRTFEPQSFGPDVRTVFGGIGVDLVGRTEAVECGEVHAVERWGDDVEAGGALAVEGLAQVEQRQLQVVAGLREGHAAAGREGVALVDGRFGLFARGGQRPAPPGLLLAQRQLAFGHADHLLVVEHLQIERHDVDRHILAGALHVLHGGREVQFPGFDPVVDAHALKQGHGGRDVERPRGLVLRLIGVVARQHAAERGVGADRSVQVGQAAVFRRREIHVALLDLQRAPLHVDVVALGEADAVVERPGGVCRGRLPGALRSRILCTGRHGGEQGRE